MNPKTSNFFLGVILILVLTANLLRAQEAPASLSGTITDSTGRVLPDVKVSVQNTDTGRSTDTQTNSGGLYTVLNLAPGPYEVSVAAAEGAKVTQVTLTAGASKSSICC